MGKGTATIADQSRGPEGCLTNQEPRFSSVEGSDQGPDLVIIGSFNFTKMAEEKNAENLIIVKSEEMAKLYKDNWDAHRQHSEVLAPRY